MERAGLVHLDTLTALLNNTFKDWLASQGVSRIDMLSPTCLWFTVQGELKTGTLSTRVLNYTIGFLSLTERKCTKNPEAIADALKCYSSDGDGAYVLGYPRRLHGSTNASGAGMGTARWWLFLA